MIEPIALGGSVVFSAAEVSRGRELWRSDGTSAGTYMLADLRPVAVELGLGRPEGLVEVVVGYLRVEDLVAVPGEERRFDAAGDHPPAVE